MRAGERGSFWGSVVVAAILVTALSGSAYALIVTGNEVKNGSLTGKDVMNGSLKGKDLRDGGIKSRQVKDGSLRKSDMSYDAVSAEDSQLLGRFVSDPLTVAEADGFVSLATVDVTLTRTSDVLVTNNMLIGSSGGGTSSALTFRLLVDGSPLSAQTPQDILRPGDERRSNIAITSKRLGPGTHTLDIQLQVAGSDVVAGGRSVNLLAIPSS